MNITQLVKAARSSGMNKLAPKFLKLWIRNNFGLKSIYQTEWEDTRKAILARSHEAPQTTQSPVCIIHDWTLRHAYYEAACRELGVPYSVMDITAGDWVEKAVSDTSPIYFIRPFVMSSFGRGIYEERAYFLSHFLKKNLFPSYDDLWAYESKRRCAALLQWHRIPHPRTWVFFSQDEAMKFAASAQFPLVFKSDLGSEAFGVRIVRTRQQAESTVRECFGRGFKSNPYDPRDRNYGQILFQEYLNEVEEWRVIRIGDSYFAYAKGKQGQFHSGSKIVLYGEPPPGLLDFSKQALDRLQLNCVSLDVFVRAGKEFFVNEIQTYYGANETNGIYFENGLPVTLEENQTIEMMIKGRAGRYYCPGGDWIFEEGDFSRNAGCNLRVKLAFQGLGQPLPGYRV